MWILGLPGVMSSDSQRSRVMEMAKKKKAIKKNKVNPYILLERCPRYTVKEKQQVREQY